MGRSRLLSKLAKDINTDGDIIQAGLADGVGGAGVTVFDSTEDLTYSGNDNGDQAYVKSNNRLYIWDSVGWYNVALINNAPSITSVTDSGGGTTPFTLATDGTATVITIVASDSDGDQLTYSVIKGTGFDSIATLSQDSSVFTITPFSQDSVGDATSGTLTFKATDGINIVSSALQTFTLSFSPDFSSIVLSQTIDSFPQSNVNDQHGADVLIGGDQIFIGAPFYDFPPYRTNSGAYFVYDRDSANAGTFTYKEAIAPDVNSLFAGRQFKSASLDNDNNVLAVGCHYYSSNRGRVYTFRKDSTGSWSQEQYLGQGGTSARFGCNTAIGNNTLVVGEYGHSSSSGRVRVYTRDSAEGLFDTTNVEYITPSDLASNDQFGETVDITSSGSYIVAGAKGQDNSDDNGAVYVFKRINSSYTQVAKIVGSAGNNTFFGTRSVAIDSGSDGTLTLAAPTSNNDLYVYTGADSSWSLQQSFKASGSNYFNSFRLDGDTMVIGAYGTYDGEANGGSAWIYQRENDSWGQVSELLPDSVSVEDRFGFATSIDAASGIVLVSAHNADVNGNENAGIVYVYKAPSP